MRTKLAFVIIYVFTFSLTFNALCRPQMNSMTGKKEKEVFRDRTFTRGFSLTPLDPKIVQQGGGFEKTNVDTLYFGKEKQTPVWQLAQWYSKYNLAHVNPESGDDGSITYKNEGKRLIRYADGSLMLELTTSKEYDHPRKNGEPWPHILLEQQFGDQSPTIGKVTDLLFSMEIKLIKCENKMNEQTFDEKLHTAQSPFYFVLENCNKDSKEYGKYIWIGIPSFDYRYKRTGNEEKISWDIGTSTYIYNVPENILWGEVSFQDGNWHKAFADILPLIKRALETMHTKGVFTNTTLNDLKITGMNFGWEIPGTFDAAVCIKNFSLRVTE